MNARLHFDQRLPQEFYRKVQLHTAEALRDEGFQVLVTNQPTDVAYLTGFFFHPCERPITVILTHTGETSLLVPQLEAEHARTQDVVAELEVYFEYPGSRSPFSLLQGRFPKESKVALAQSTSIQVRKQLELLLGISTIPTDLIDRLRAIKFEEEIKLHREAARITDAMLTEGANYVRDSLHQNDLPTEEQLERFVTQVGLKLIRDEHSRVVRTGFLTGGLVYGGPNSSNPHALPTARKLQRGESFMLSLGAAIGGRYVEGERTFFIGPPSTQQANYYEAVFQAQKSGHEAIAAHVSCAESNAICLKVLHQAGYGAYVLHRQGHGIGLDMHEPPWLEAGDATPLRPGMLVSNEPGLYIAGHAGYRISDTTLVTTSGATSLTKMGRTITDAIIQ